MEPEIRHTTTADGVSIAYYAMGEGRSLVVQSVMHAELIIFTGHRGGTREGDPPHAHDTEQTARLPGNGSA